jgi:oxygen-dependent protoporphyrinogen oxidase
VTRVAVVGGGISGLAAARSLLQQGLHATVFEKESRLGGVLRTRREGELLLEEGPDSLVATKPAAIDLCEALGVELIGTRSENQRSLVVRDGRLLEVPEGFVLLAPTRLGPLLRSPLFSWAGKARMALDLLLPRGGAARHEDVDETLAAFVRRRLGKEALVRLAQPMLGGVVAGDPEHLSVRAVMPMLVQLERDHRSIVLGMRRRRRMQRAAQAGDGIASGARYGLFRTPKHGMQALIEALRQDVDERGGAVRTSSTVERIAPGWTVNGEPFDGIVVALPVRAAADLLAPTDPELHDAVEAIETTSTATLNLVFRAKDVRHPLPAFGFVVPACEGLSLMACTFTSRKYAGRSGADTVVLRAFVGGALGEAAYAQSDDELIARALADLKSLLGIDAAPTHAVLVRWPNRFPKLVVGHRERVSAIRSAEARLPGLAVAGNYLTGAGISDCLASAAAAAAKLRDDLADRKRSSDPDKPHGDGQLDREGSGGGSVAG